MSIRSKRRRYACDAGVLAALAVTAVAFWKWRLITPAAILVASPSTFANTGNGDFFTQTYPMWHRAAQWIFAGELPLWNPFQYGGHPFLATALYGVLYPVNWVAWLFPTATAIEIANVAHMVAAGAFTYLFGRTIALSRPAAAFMGLTFMLSGFVAAETSWFPPAIASAAWLPLGLIGIEHIIASRAASRAFRGAAMLAVAVAMPVYAGWLQSWVYSLYALGAYAAVRVAGLCARQETRAHAWPVVALLGAGVVLGLGLAAAQLLPTIELMQLGPRRPGALPLDYTLAVGTTSPRQLAVEMTDSTPGYPRFAYLGMLPLLLAPLAVWSGRRDGRVLCFAGLALASLAVALTIYSPLFSVYRLLPGAAWFRKPQRILFLYAFAAAALAGCGFHALVADDQGAPAEHRRRFVVLGVVFVAVLLLVTGAPIASWVSLAAGAVLSMIVTYGRERRRRAVLVAALFAVVLCDLGRAARNPYLHPIHGTEALDRPRAVFDFIRARQGWHRTYVYNPNPFDYALMAKQGTLRGIYSITDYEPLSLSRYERFFDLITPTDRSAKHLTFTGSLVANPADFPFRALDLFGVRYIVAPRGADPLRRILEDGSQGWRLVLTSTDENYVVYERSDPFPRAYVAHVVRRATGAEDALRAVTAPEFDPRASVVLEIDAAAALPAGGDASIHAAMIEEYSPRHVVATTNDDEAGYLVLTDTFYPGWTASVDGRPAPILRANYVFRAVPVPAGTHRVTFQYAPVSFALGLGVTGVAVVVLALGLSGYLPFWSSITLRSRHE